MMLVKIVFVIISLSIRGATPLPTLDTNEIAYTKNFTLSAREILEPRKS
jgi:hypothetical protein